MSTQSSRSKIPLLLVIGGGICFALGRRTLGLVLSGIGGILFALRPKDDAPPPSSE